MKVLVLGADGFIGRHIAFFLRQRGHEVIASARRTDGLERMGFRVLAADLTDPSTHSAEFWRPHLSGDVRLVNAAGLLTGTDAMFRDVHVSAPAAVYTAMDPNSAGVLISAVGIDAQTPFARWRRDGEALASDANLTILRPGLVLADTSYGGSSLLRALAAIPLRMPVVGSGNEAFNPIHATDLAEVVAECLADPPGHGPWDIGGAETVTQVQLISAYRDWLGRPPVPILHLPRSLALSLGRIGDALRLGPISATAIRQMETGVLADAGPLLSRIGARPRTFSDFLNARPAGTQDLWQARLYLIKPLVRVTLALLWLVSGLLGLFLPSSDFLPLFTGSGLSDSMLTLGARAGGMIDLALAAALFRNWRPRLVGIAQLGMVVGYTVALSILLPGLWLAPFGELLKNVPIIVLILVHLALVEER